MNAMDNLFTPSAHLLGFIPGGWLTIGIALAVCAILAWMIGRKTVTPGWPLGGLLMAIVAINGFTYGLVPLWATVAFWAVWGAGLLGWIHHAFTGIGRGAWRFMAMLAVISLLGSVGIASNGDGTLDVASAKALAQQFADQAKVNAAQVAKDAEQDARLTDLERRVSALEDAQKGVAEKISGLEAIVGGITYTVLPADMSPQAQAKAIEEMARQLAAAGWQPGELSFGQVDWSKNVYDVSERKFAKSWINSSSELQKFLAGTSAASQAARDHITSVLPEAEQARALSGKGFIPLQFNKDVCLSGNTYFLDGRAVRTENKVCHASGDVVWIYVGTDGVIWWDASVRADCGNPGCIKPPEPKNPPVRTGGQPTPSTSTTSTPTSTPSPTPSTSTTSTPTSTPSPTCPPDKPHGTYPVCKDGGSVASSVGPTQVRGTEAPAGTASAPAVAKPTTANTPPAAPAAPRTTPAAETTGAATGTVGD